MRKVIGTVFVIFGLLLIGLGTFNEFELFEQRLIRDNKKSYYDGVYLTSGDTVFVSSQNKETIKVSINDEAYEFIYNGQYYENKESGFYIIFSENDLTLFKDGEKIRTLQKEK